jgi:aminopeptidase N
MIVSGSACRVIELRSGADNEIVTDTIEVSQPVLSPELSAEQKYPYRPSQTRYHDLLHTRLEVRFDMDAHTLHGIATLQLRPYFRPQDQLQLDAKGFEIHEVLLLEGNENKALDYEYDLQHLNIDLGKTFTRDQDFMLKIRYTAHPDEVELTGSAAITEDKGLYFIGTDTSALGIKPVQVWTQGETEANSCWFPTIDAPNERSTQEMFITVDTTFRTLSNGVLVSSQYNDDHTRTDYWKMDQPHAPYLFMMAVGEFAVVEDSWQGKPVSYLVEPDYEKYARDIFGRTPEMMTYFSDLLGVEYPWEKYAQVVVRDFVSGAMENTTASVFMEDLQVDDRELLDYHWDGIIAHELFHHWFGDLVTCESWANLPLNESFATYAEYLWHDHKYGKEEGDFVLWEQKENYFTEAEEKKVDLIRFHYADQEDMFDRHSYDKGSLILHMLRDHLGDEVFFASLRHYLNKHAYTSVEVHDLRLAFEEVSGEDLNWFFNQWFFAAGHPELEVTHRYDSGKLYIQTRQLQDISEAPLYYLPVVTEIWEKGKKSQYLLEVDQLQNEWELEMASKPELLLIDPDNKLLMEVDHQKSAEEWLYQAKRAEHFLKRYEALNMISEDSILEKEAEVLRTALDDNYWFIRQTALNILELNPEVLTPEDKELVKKMVREDEKSLVRADAISVLSALDAGQYQSTFRQALMDSSYAVVGSAIAAYAQTETTDKTEVFAPYQVYTNFNIVIALADYYTENEVEGKFGWFEEKFTEINDEALYYLLNYFARYLIDLQQEEQREGIFLLADYARFHPKYYIRLNAYRSLSFFDDQEEVSKLRNQIRTAEKDQRLQSIYKSIP